MLKKTLFLLMLVPLLFVEPALTGQSNDFFQGYYPAVNETFEAKSALRTVAFVEKYWRVVGNEGFNASIMHVVEKLEKAGFVDESNAGAKDRLVYRLEKRALKQPTWEPVSGRLSLASGEELLNSETNRHMMTINSYSTEGEQEYEVVYIGTAGNFEWPDDVAGKIVYADAHPSMIFRGAVQKRGAAGVIGYYLPVYLQPEKNVNSIQFGSIPYDPGRKAFGLMLSYSAREKLKAALAKGENKLKLDLQTKVYESEELTLVAELKGSVDPEKRFVFSAHVQEPGANDNASGVGVLAEVAASSARLLKAGQIDPERTITYLFGDEIVSTRRYIVEDEERAKNIKWGMSLDMVGENTAVTGGSFLIEKMPDPGAIWVRGVEKHSEWGGSPLSKADLKPHYFNDLAISVFEEIGARKQWTVNFNPFEGGSDHVPFLRADIPGLLLWHFTDQFYHTDQDRLNKVSPATLKNVGVGALTIALMLTENKPDLTNHLFDLIMKSMENRLKDELELSKQLIAEGGSRDEQVDILSTWLDYYAEVLEKIVDIEPKDQAQFDKDMGIYRILVKGFKNRIQKDLN